ncbi:MAG: AbrB/MazE/SpoVT family DNA-binding domain-containing protein [Actinomycetia bacterium]|nr:AbrB/MazE/SpoVT family DNA-binding domain-containing protein [Actinomycetes bacterium]
METTIDSLGRIVVPKQWRTALGLAPGSTVDISPYGGGIQIVAGGRTARLVRDDDGRLVAASDTVVTDEMVAAALADECARPDR